MASAALIDDGALRQQVANLQDGHTELKKGFRDLDIKVDAGFESLSKKLDTKTTPQWQAIGIVVTVLLFIGGIFVSSMNEKQSKLDAAIEVMRRENEGRIVKLWDSTNQTARDLAYLQGQLHPLPQR